MAKTYPTKWFNNLMQGAGQTGQVDAGSMIAIFKACLTDGFGSLPPDAIVWDATESCAKATFNSGHKYLVDSIIACSGSSSTDYNGEHRVMKVTTNELWFELDTVPTEAAIGALEIKIAPLGWTITHSNITNDILIFQAGVDVGNVSFRVDNSAWAGWNGAGTVDAYLMKVAMVENVTDINTYDLIYEHRWPATGSKTDESWDLVGDNRIMFFMPKYGAGNESGGYCAGYINSNRAGDRYHFIMNHLPSTAANIRWDQATSTYSYYTYFARNFSTAHQVIARKYHQLHGTDSWMKTGIGVHNSDLLLVPNPADNGFYISAENAMVLESDKTYRGGMPIVIYPLGNNVAYDRKNLQGLPDFPNKIFRMLTTTSEIRADLPAVLIGFDISTVEV